MFDENFRDGFLELFFASDDYSESVIRKALYWVVNENQFELKNTDGGFIFSISIKESEKTDFLNLLSGALNDFKLREILNNETKDLKTILYAKAFLGFDDDVLSTL